MILYILSISFWSLLLLLGLYCFCPLLFHLWMKYFFDISSFLEEISSLSPSVVFLFFFALFTEEGLLSLLVFCGPLCSVGCTFLFPPCFFTSLPLQLFVNPPQTTTLPSCFSFSLGWFCSMPLYNIMDLCP